MAINEYMSQLTRRLDDLDERLRAIEARDDQ